MPRKEQEPVITIRTMIDTAVQTLAEKDHARMRAAMELGVRFAIEAIQRISPYSSDATEVLAELEREVPGSPPATTAPPPATAAPWEQPEAAAQPEIGATD